MEVHVVGGAYEERCVHPRWNEVYGSAGRAAIAIAKMGHSVDLHAYMSTGVQEEMEVHAAWHPGLRLNSTPVLRSVGFDYSNDSAVPEIRNVPAHPFEPIRVAAERVVRFGMLEGEAIVDADSAVYDPQNADDVRSFHENGSVAKRLALVLNQREAAVLARDPSGGVAPAGSLPSAYGTAPLLAHRFGADVVVIKEGPRGAWVWAGGRGVQVPAYRTADVWKIGSGDCFVAHFASAWMLEGRRPEDAADRASRATAFYCETKVLPSVDDLDQRREPIVISEANRERCVRQVYLAGPFFDLGQIWMVERTRERLRDLGLEVFSPFHEVGTGGADNVVAKDLEAIGQCDLVLALTDGLDPGTVFEIGFARALGKPVIVYSERHRGESLKMMEGSDCIICDGYTTALYTTLWEALRL